MQRVTISFPEETLRALEKNAANRGLSLAHYLRELVEQGLRLEGAEGQLTTPISPVVSEKLSAEGDVDFCQLPLEWALESRYLLRYLVDSLVQQSAEKRAAVLRTAAEKAQKFVTELWQSKA